MPPRPEDGGIVEGAIAFALIGGVAWIIYSIIGNITGNKSQELYNKVVFGVIATLFIGFILMCIFLPPKY